MSVVGMSGNDSIVINNRVFSNLATGDVATLTYPTDIAAVKTGKNGNSVYALNETGKQADFMVKVVRGSSDDLFLLGLLSSQLSNFPGFPLMIGQFIKNIGDGAGNIAQDTYITSGGIFTKIPEAKSNVEGNTDQAEVSYHIKFTNAPRVVS